MSTAVNELIRTTTETDVQGLTSVGVNFRPKAVRRAQTARRVWCDHPDGGSWAMHFELSRGLFALVSLPDWRRVSAHSWSAVPTMSKRVNHYAVASITPGRASLHRFLMGGEAPEVDHIDGDGLNNTRWNLRSCTRAVQAMNKRKTNELAALSNGALPPGCSFMPVGVIPVIGVAS